MPAVILMRGGGDLASGVALRLVRVGLRVVISELAQPLAVRRLVSFSEAVYTGEITVEDVTARLADDFEMAQGILEKGQIAVLVDPSAQALSFFTPPIIIDARMTKRAPDLGKDAAALTIGLGPGFIAGENCHAAIETNRGHRLGRVIWEGTPQPDTGVPDGVANKRLERVLRAPADGVLKTYAAICDHVEAGALVAKVGNEPVKAPFPGVLRGLLRADLQVWRGLKIGDLDPRDDPSYCTLVSDKSLAIAGGVLEAILSQPDFRLSIWD